MNSGKMALKSDQLNKYQLKVFFTMTTLYTFYFACNYNLSAAAKLIQDELGISSSSFGALFTTFTIVFACGQFIMGFLGDRYSPKAMMYIGAVGCVISNYLFGTSDILFLFILFWGFNSLFLSMGWAPGCSILVSWLPKSKWGVFMGIYNAFSYLGGVIVYPMAGFFILRFGWRAAFFIPPLFLLLWSFVFLKIVKSTPKDAGMAAEWETESNPESSEKIGWKDYRHVLAHPVMNIVYLSAICSQFVRWGLVNWVIKVLSEPAATGGFGMDIVTSTTIGSLMHWGGAFFSLALGYLSDRVFKGSRWQTISIGFFMSSAALMILFFLGPSIMNMTGGLVLLSIILFISGGCVQGVQAPIFNLPGDILGSRLSGTGTGITNGWSYIGASLSGIFLGWVLDSFGLMSGFILMAGVSFAGGIAICFVKK